MFRILILVLGPPLIALHAQGQVVVQGRCVDTSDGTGIAYAGIATADGITLGITNEEGRFRITAPSPEDTLVFAHLAYQRLLLPVSRAAAAATVGLTPVRSELPAITVQGRDDAAHRLVLRCASLLRAADAYEAKVHYQLGTHRPDGRPLEVIECFYNGTFNGTRITGLHLKNGRIAVAPDEGRYVLNLNTSKAIALLDITARDGAFPDTPLAFRKLGALRRHFDLTVTGILHGTEEVQHIRFTPRADAPGACFSGELWIGAHSARLHRIDLACAPCSHHPFRSVDPAGRLEDVRIHYTQRWNTDGPRPMIDHILLNYAVVHRSDTADGRSAFSSGQVGPEGRPVASQGIVRVFDRDRPFIAPLFNHDGDQPEYRQILSFPTDTAFWRVAPVIPRTEAQERDMTFMAANGTLSGQRPLNEGVRGSFFESNMATWSADRRITLKGTHVRTEAVRSQGQARPAAMEVALKAQLFLNIDPVPGGFRTFSATILDGFHSWYHLPEQPWTNAFLNLYFDLCEIERQRLEKALAEPHLPLHRIRQLHEEAAQRMEQVTGRYLKDTRYGMDRAALDPWNDRVRQALGLDNLALFGLNP